MVNTFESYRVIHGSEYKRPAAEYNPSEPSLIEGYVHPPAPTYKKEDWESVYSRLSEEEQSRLKKIDWHTDYSRLDEDVKLEIEGLVCQAIASFPDCDFVSLISDTLNVHRWDVVSASLDLYNSHNIRRTEESDFKEFELRMGEAVPISSAV